MTQVPFWTDERCEKLISLLKEGLSGSQIGGVLGCTRNAVIGKAHRIEAALGQKLERVRKAPAPPRQPRVATTPSSSAILVAHRPQALQLAPQAPREPKPPARASVPAAAPARRPVTMPAGIAVDGKAAPRPGQVCGILQVNGCRWPVGVDEKVIGRHLFCNAERGDDRYCATHAALHATDRSRDVDRKPPQGAPSRPKRVAA